MTSTTVRTKDSSKTLRSAISKLFLGIHLTFSELTINRNQTAIDPNGILSPGKQGIWPAHKFSLVANI